MTRRIPEKFEPTLVRRLLSGSLENYRVMHLDHAVYHEIEERRKQRIHDVRLLHKLNLDGKVAALARPLMTLPAMVLAKPSLRTQNCGA